MGLYKVEICGVNTAALPILEEKEKEELFKRVMQGDKLARDKYIECNLRLVLSVIRRFSNSGENIDDLFQIGCIGLIKAIDNFDVSLGLKFSTYAVPMISGEVRRFLRDDSSLRVSRSLKDIAYKVLCTKESLLKETLREPTLQEIANVLELSVEEVTEALDAMQAPVSLYEPVYNDNGDTLYVLDQISDKKNLEESLVTDIALNDAIKRLTAREREIITKRFFQGKTQSEVASEISISQAQVSRLEKNALKQMHAYLN